MWFRPLIIRVLSAVGLLGVARRIKAELATSGRSWRRRLTWLRYRRKPASVGLDVADVFHEDHWCPAVADRTLRARDIKAANLRLAADIAEGAGVPYSFVETPSRFRHRIAVFASRHGDILTALSGSDDPPCHT